MRARGVMEDELQTLNFPHLSILKPGAITGRGKGERYFETLARYIPIFPKISAHEVGLGQKIEAELQHSNPHPNKTVIYENNDIHYLVKNGTYPKQK